MWRQKTVLYSLVCLRYDMLTVVIELRLVTDGLVLVQKLVK